MKGGTPNWRGPTLATLEQAAIMAKALKPPAPEAKGVNIQIYPRSKFQSAPTPTIELCWVCAYCRKITGSYTKCCKHCGRWRT